jgi:hypothetical protein
VAVALHTTDVKAYRCASGGKNGASERAIAVTKGRRNTKRHALVDELCRPWVIILAPGNLTDRRWGRACVSLMTGIERLLGDKVMTALRRKSLRRGRHPPMIPGGPHRKKPIRHGKEQGPQRGRQNFVGNWNQASKSVLLSRGNVLQHVRA